MKATDLMIGDYVFWDCVTHKVDFDGDVMTDRGYEVSKHIIKVSSVNESCITFKSLKDGSQISIREEDLSPILLTPEILEKNGFVVGYKQVDYEQISITYYHIWSDFYLDLYGGEILLKIRRDCDFTFFGIISCKYVHALQHALRLCGIEKEVIL